MREARIFKNNIFCGVLKEDEEGFHFKYDSDYLGREDALPISPTMPLTGRKCSCGSRGSVSW